MGKTWNSMSPGARIRRAHMLFWWALVFPLSIIVFVFTALSTTLNAQAILNDYSIANATISADAAGASKRQLTHFRYSFQVNGKSYGNSFEIPSIRANEIRVGDTIPVAYANFDPSQSQRETLLSTDADLNTNLTSAIKMTAFTATLIALFWFSISLLVQKKTENLDRPDPLRRSADSRPRIS